MKFLTLLLCLFVFSPTVHALVEIRAFGGGNFPNSNSGPDDQNLNGMNRYLKTNGITEIYLNGVSGADGSLFIPFSDKFFLGLGVRYDEQNIAVKGSNGDESRGIDLFLVRWSAFMQFRLAGDHWYAGTVLGAGYSHTPQVKLKIDNQITTYDTGYGESFFGGIEGGVKFGWLVIGSEVGLQSYLITDLKNSNERAPLDINLGGLYAIGTVGFHF